MNITEFLVDRIAEDEQRARNAATEWDEEWQLMEFEDLSDDAFAHARTFDPARVLAECRAKRIVVELRYSWNLQAEHAPELPFGPILKAQAIAADAIIRALTAVYADHPDYRDEWRP